MPDTALIEAIRRVLIACPFHGEGYRKVWSGCAMPACAPRKNACAA